MLEALAIKISVVEVPSHPVIVIQDVEVMVVKNETKSICVQGGNVEVEHDNGNKLELYRQFLGYLLDEEVGVRLENLRIVVVAKFFRMHPGGPQHSQAELVLLD